MLGGETSGLLHTAASAESVGISSSLSMSSGRQSCGWRLPQDLFREVRRTTEELERLSKRCQRHFRTDVRKRIVNYYRDQNELLDLFEQADALDTQMGQGGSRPEVAAVEETEVENSDEDAAALPLRVSFLSNVFLLLLKLIVCYFSGSLSIIVSALDSVLDIVSGFILMATALAIKHRNKYRFPIGKERMEPVGIIVFSCIMGTVGFSVLVEGLRQLLGDEHTHHLESLAWPVAGMISVILVKLGLWVYCRRSTNPAVQVYAADHFNDVCTNSIGLAFALLGDRVVYWMDPLGAMLLAAWVTFNWGCTAHEHALNLVGQSASPQYLQMLTLMCWNHHPAIQLIDTVRAYTFGNKLFAEVDVVLPAAMTLTEAHDIGESLQYKLECLPEIERAFVHLDYEAGHKPEHDNRQPPPQMGPRNPLFASAVEPPAGEPSTAATQLQTHSHTL